MMGDSPPEFSHKGLVGSYLFQSNTSCDQILAAAALKGLVLEGSIVGIIIMESYECHKIIRSYELNVYVQNRRNDLLH